MSIRTVVSIDEENGEEFVQYCLEINGDDECFESREDAEKALKDAQPKAPGMDR